MTRELPGNAVVIISNDYFLRETATHSSKVKYQNSFSSKMKCFSYYLDMRPLIELDIWTKILSFQVTYLLFYLIGWFMSYLRTKLKPKTRVKVSRWGPFCNASNSTVYGMNHFMSEEANLIKV